MLFILNGAIHEVETRYRQKDGQKRSRKYFNAFIVHVMLVGYLTFEIHADCNYHKVKNVQVMLQSGLSLCVKALKYTQGNSIRYDLVPYNSMTNLNCDGNLF